MAGRRDRCGDRVMEMPPLRWTGLNHSGLSGIRLLARSRLPLGVGARNLRRSCWSKRRPTSQERSPITLRRCRNQARFVLGRSLAADPPKDGVALVASVWCPRTSLWPGTLGATTDSSRAISLFIPDAFVSRVVEQGWDVEPRNVEIRWQSRPRSGGRRRVEESAVEARDGSPSGPLFAESACEFLTHHVVRTYLSLSAHPPRARGGSTGRRLRIVQDYIHDNLAQTISLRQLAQLAGVGPRHFERAFRQAVGVPPHAYVTRKRVAAARRLLISSRV